MLPNCNYQATDDVRMDTYVNQALDTFSSRRFLDLLGQNLLTVDSQVRMVTPISRFNKTNLLLTVPGYAVQRFLAAIDNGDQWTQDLFLESSYIVDLPVASSETTAFPAFQVQPGVYITVEGMVWVIIAIILVAALLLIECCLSKNDESQMLMVVHPMPHERYRIEDA